MAKKKKTKEDYYLASQWTLMARKLRRHKLARVSLFILAILYLGALFADFLAPYSLDECDGLYRNSAPTAIYTIFEGEHVGPHVSASTRTNPTISPTPPGRSRRPASFSGSAASSASAAAAPRPPPSPNG